MSETGVLTETPATVRARVGALEGACLPEGALYLIEERMLVVADLHLEKGSAYARRGVFLPPYDTAATLQRLLALVARVAPRVLVLLGDSFHDLWASERICPADRDGLSALGRGRDLLWVQGNHDRGCIPGLQGESLPSVSVADVTLRHEPGTGAGPEIVGHLHPVARIAGSGLSVRRRCFVGDGTRMVLPAFGAYAGGLNICEPVFAALFEPRRMQAHALGRARVYAIPRSRLLPG